MCHRSQVRTNNQPVKSSVSSLLGHGSQGSSRFCSRLTTYIKQTLHRTDMYMNGKNVVEFPSCHSVTHEQLFAGTFSWLHHTELRWPELYDVPSGPLYDADRLFGTEFDTHTHCDGFGKEKDTHTHTHCDGFGKEKEQERKRLETCCECCSECSSVRLLQPYKHAMS